MRASKTKALAAFAAVMAVFAVGVPIVLAAGDTDDSLSPASKPIAVSLKAGTTAKFSGTVDGFSITVTCTASTTKFTTPAKGLGPVVASNPTFTGCKDNTTNTDTVTANSTNGHWTSTFVDAPNDETKEVAGDKVKLTIPKAGVKIVSKALPSCTVTVAPTAAASESAAYNDVSTATFSKAPVPTSGSGCTTSATGTFSATYVLSPGIHDVS